MNSLDNYYLQQKEPEKSCLLALREIILLQDAGITHELKYGMPFFCFRGKMFCYLWYHKKYRQPYIGFVEGKHFKQAFLIQEKRSRMKIMLLNPAEDLPVQLIGKMIQQALDLYKSGLIATTA